MYDDLKRLSQQEARGLFEKVGVIQRRHRLLAGGTCTGPDGIYLDFDVLLEQIQLLKRVCYELACRIAKKYPQEVHCVLGPAHGGNPIAEQVAGFLDRDYKERHAGGVMYVPTEKDPRSGQVCVVHTFLEDLSGKSIIIVDDVLNHGTRIRQLRKCLGTRGVQVVVLGIAVFWKRSRIGISRLHTPMVWSIVNEVVPDMKRTACPRCRTDRHRVLTN